MKTSTSGPNNTSADTGTTAALVFGASGEQGRAVIEGFVDAGYSPVYGFTSNPETIRDPYLSDALQCVLLKGELSNQESVRKALLSTKAQAIFLTTATEMPAVVGAGYQEAQDEEYEVIVQFFDTLKQVHEEDRLPRTIVFSTRDNVQEEYRASQTSDNAQSWKIEPLDDGSIIPHFSAKGKGGQKGLQMMESIPGVNMTLVTMPFFFSNFLAFFTPLPNEGRTQWELSASFGDGTTKIDMMSVIDVGTLIPNICANAEKYNGKNLRVAAERISMDQVAHAFSELYGKDVIYNPLLPSELAALDFAAAPAMAQMCQYLGSPNYQKHDIDATATILRPRRPMNFASWLLTHSDSIAFARVGLDLDAPELTKICVFGALSPEGKSVVRGLLADSRKSYQIRGTTRRSLDDPAVQELVQLDPNRISFFKANFDDVASCKAAVKGMDGAFLVADLHDDGKSPRNSEIDIEETHARNIIDACEGRIKHLVFSTMESSELVNEELPEKELLAFSPKARIAAYARTKRISVTFVLMPCYSEVFFDLMDVRKEEGALDEIVFRIPADKEAKVMCMSVEELGPAVATIFDSYECFAGHEIGLVTDFVTVSEVQDILQEAFVEHKVEHEVLDTKEWIEARDTYMKDLGQLFASVSHSSAVKSRHSMARTFQLVPNARNLRRWVEHNRDDPAFREKLGLR